MSNRALVLTLLEQAGDRGVTTAELLRAGTGSRYGARIMELREQGHIIQAERLRAGAWRYRLLPPSPAVSPSPQEGLAPASSAMADASGAAGEDRLFEAPQAKPRPRHPLTDPEAA